MKYLLEYLEGIPEAPKLSEPNFQQLLVDVQAGKSQTRSSDSFFESLEKIVNELKSSPESAAFQKPVSKRDAPDYLMYISKPMDLSTVLRNVKQRKYKSKADFAADLDLIWENCLLYNTQETHPLRAAARFMQQKTNHHLEFLVDRTERGSTNKLPLRPSLGGASPSRLGPSGTLISLAPTVGSPGRDSAAVQGDDEDAAGESEDGTGVATGSKAFTPRPGMSQEAGPSGLASVNGNGRSGSVSSVSGEKRANGNRINGVTHSSPPPFRPKLQTSLDQSPALLRTPYSMTQYLPISLSQPGPSFSDKGKAKEILYGTAAPPWYPLPSTEDEDSKLEGYWWGATSKDEAFVAGLPCVPTMASGFSSRRKRIPRKDRKSLPNGNVSDNHNVFTDSPPPLVHSKPLSLGRMIEKTVDQLHQSRQTTHKILEWQRIEMEGLIQPKDTEGNEDKIREEEERIERKRRRVEEREETRKRRRIGGEVGEEEAAKEMKRASASLLAHAGFEGANEIALDMFTRVAIDNLRNLGRTFRLLLDGFSQQMPPEEIVLHALNENGQVKPEHLETYIKEGVEKNASKVSEVSRKLKQAYKEVTTAPVIEDDMMFNENGEMLLDGNFAEELGEDFLGLRDLGIDKEYGMSTLSVPSSLFYGRRKRGADALLSGAKVDIPDYAPPPPFIALNPSTYLSHLPNILHPFFTSRLSTEKGLADDANFDQAHAQIGPLGQIVTKNPPAVAGRKKDKREGREGDGVDGKSEAKKVSVKKVVQPGVGKGNWIRPSKEEREKKAAEKKAALEARNSVKLGLGVGGGTPMSEDAMGEEEDAEGEEE